MGQEQPRFSIKPRATCGMRPMLMASAIFVTGCSAATAKTVDLSCVVEGAQYLGTADSICAKFKPHIDTALSVKTRSVSNFSAHVSGEALGLKIRILKRGGLVAQVQRRANGKIRQYPEIALDVMDRPLTMRDIDVLAKEVVKAIAR